MLLSRSDILKAIESRQIVIDPFDPARLGPNSYDLRISNELLTYEEVVLNTRRPPKYRRMLIPEAGFTLLPSKLYLAGTVEYTETHGLVPFLDGRSSTGRLGLSVHVTAGRGDVGFCGHWTLELHVVEPLTIYPGTPLCQIYYMQVSDPTGPTYNGKYQNSRGVVPSRLFPDPPPIASASSPSCAKSTAASDPTVAPPGSTSTTCCSAATPDSSASAP